MGVRKRENLTVVELPEGRHAVSVRSVLVGSCGAVLLHADVGQVYGLLIHCAWCGSHNSTGG